MREISGPVTRASSLALLLAIHLSAQHPSNFGGVPLYFEQNKGQTDAQAKYIARSPNLVGFVLQDGWTLSPQGQPISMHIAGANAKATLLPESPVEGVTNYYIGSRAITNLPHYSSVRAKDIRPGIDIVYHGNERDLEYDLVIHPGADVDALWLRFEGSNPTLGYNGDIVLKTTAGEVRQHAPRVWQEANGRRTEVECRYVLAKSGNVGFVLSNYDPSAELTIDPIISYSTYLSSPDADDNPTAIAADGSGYAYLTGYTFSLNFPVTLGTNKGSRDVFVTKLNPTGTGLVYSTFIGGISTDISRGIATDNAGNAYVTGDTSSADFPVTVYTFTIDQGPHAFAVKLGGTGNIVYSTALSGNNSDYGKAIATDASGSAYVVGNTYSTNFPVTAGSYKTTPGGGGDAFVAKLSSTGQISHATYLGGSGSVSDSATAIAVDASGNAFVGGITSSANFPTTVGGYATTYAGNQDAFVVKLNPAGSALVYSTYLGGTGLDSLTGLAIDAAGNCYVTGNTQSVDFPITPGAFRTSTDSFNSGFVTKLSATGASLVYSTFLGGNVLDSTLGIAVDSNGSAYLAGSTSAGSSQINMFPATPGALKTVPTLDGFSCCDYDMFLVRVSVDGSALSYSTLLGGSGMESAAAIALDGIGGVYVLGASQRGPYPTTAGAYQTSSPKDPNFALQSIVICKIDFSAPTLCNPSVAPQSQSLPGRGGAISFNLTLSPGCPWEAALSASFNPFITLTGTKYGVVSTSPVLITGTVPQNSNTSSGLTQMVRIGAATFTVNQDAGSCQDPVISPLSVAFDSSGGIRNLSLTLPSSCNWMAVPGAAWLSASNNASGAGPASITISAGPNSFSARSTTLTIAGKSINVTQSGSTCTATANISVSSTSSQGSDGVASITTNSSACTWYAYATVPWIQLNNLATTGQGAGFVPFIVAANPGAIPRTGQILIADITLSITQDAGPAGTISGYSTSIIAGGGGSSAPNQGDGGPALGAYFSFPSGLAVDPVTSNLYIVDSSSSRIRVVTPDGNINTFAGGGSATGENIPATSALLSNLSYVGVDSSSAVYINDSNSRVRKISQGNIVTFAGGSSTGFSGDNGPATSAQLNFPRGIASDPAGNIYIADAGNGRVRKVSGPAITTFAGGGNNGLGDNGPATSANLSSPNGVALDTATAMNLFIADTVHGLVRKVAQGIITTVAGGGSGGDGGPATSASLSSPTNVAADPLGNIFIFEGSNARIRKVALDGTISTLVTNVIGPGLAADAAGNLYFNDSARLVRKLTALPSFCAYSVSTPPQILQSGGSVQIFITTAPGCRWGAFLIPAWLSPTSATTGVGNGAITFTASPNSGTTPRGVTLALAGMPVQVTQSTIAASLSILKTHVGSFSAGQQNATYSITVSNAAGAGPTTGLVTVTDALPSGLVPVGMSGSGWTCQTTTCTRSDVLNSGASYAPITMTVNVAANASSPQVNQVNVSGGGSVSASASDSTPIVTSTFSVNHTTLNFATGIIPIATSPQTVTVTFSGGVALAWTATSNQPNIVVSQGSGTGTGSFQVSVNVPPPNMTAASSGIVTVTAPNAAGSPKQIQVNVTALSPGGVIGSFDTPTDNSTGVAGAIPVSGWALDLMEISKVDILREPVGGEPAGALIHLGDAVFVEGARPDVEALYPMLPLNYRAGWGYQLLTNFLPQGNGTFKLHAIAYSKYLAFRDLGTKTIVVDNAHAAKPFGAIDTPSQGGTASGNAFVNFGWALTQNPNKIPIDGSTISVTIDGQPVGHPTYNQFRSDIGNLFPGYMNSGGTVGFFYIDTTTLTNGVHTISWNVFDNAGHGDGIGSRYFNVFNSGSMGQSLPDGRGSEEQTRNRTLQTRNQTLQTRNGAATVRERFPGNDPNSIEIEELGLVELPLAAIGGYQLVNGEHRPLPIGSSIKRGVFYWQPGPGFLGEYHLVFQHEDSPDMHVHVKIRPKSYAR